MVVSYEYVTGLWGRLHPRLVPHIPFFSLNDNSPNFYVSSIPFDNIHLIPITDALGSLTSFPFGLFAGMVTSAQFFGLYLCAPKQQMTTAIGMYYMSQQIGIAVGITIMSTLFNGQFEKTLQNLLADIPGFEKVSSKNKRLVRQTGH